MNKAHLVLIVCASLLAGCSSAPQSSAGTSPKKDRWGWVPFVGDKDDSASKSAPTRPPAQPPAPPPEPVVASAYDPAPAIAPPPNPPPREADAPKESGGWLPFRKKAPPPPAPPPEPTYHGEVLAITEVDTPPQPVADQVRAVYPTALRRKGVTGSAVLSFVVTPEGVTRDIRLISATQAAFADAAIDAVKKWRYIPAKKGTHAVNCAMEIPVVFNLNAY